jgi:oligopeptide transport system substrate-binding protein
MPRSQKYHGMERLDRKISLATLSLLSLLLLGGCSRQSVTVPLDTNVLRIQLPNEPISLDPTLASDGVSFQVLNNIDEGLMGYNSEGQLGNRLAESYQISKDGKKYTFILRKEARWSDAQLISVQDFITAFRRTLSPKSISSMAPTYFNIRNARKFHEGKITENQLGVREEKGKLVLELEHRVPSFLHSLTLPQSFPLRKEILDQHAGSWPESGPASGPYRIQSHKFEQSIVLEKNPYYSFESVHSPKATISKIEYKITDESTAINLFDQGMLDIVTRVSALDLPRLQRDGKMKVTAFLATYYLSFNCRKPPFNNRILRQAVAGSIRRSELVQMLGGGELPAWSWIPKGLEGYIPYQDPALVFADAIHQVNQKDGKKISIEASFDVSARNLKIMEKVQQDLLHNIHLSLNLNPLSWQAFHNSIHSNPSPLFRYGWMAPFLDPITHLRVFVTGNLNNFSGFSNSKYDSLVQEIEFMNPGTQRENKIFAAQKILLEEEAAVVPLYHYVQQTAVSARVKDFRVNSTGMIQFRDLSFVK